MTEGEFDHFADLGHLLSASTDVIVPDVGQVGLFVLTLDRLALCVDDGVLGDDAVLGWVGLCDFELYGSSGTTGDERVSFSNRSIGCVCWGKRNGW